MNRMFGLLILLALCLRPMSAHPDADATQIASPTLCATASGQNEFLAAQHFHPVAATTLDDIHQIHLWINDEGAWALVLANQRGIACIIALGRHWEGAEAGE